MADFKTYKRAIVYIFNSHYAVLSSALEGAINAFAERAFASGLICDPVMKTVVRCSHDQYSKCFADIASNFKTGLELMKNVEDMLRHCQTLTQILQDLGGPVAIVGRELDAKLSTLPDLLHLLSPYGLLYEDLDKECDDNLFIEVSEHLELVDQEKLAQCLKLSSKTLKRIAKDKQDDLERMVDILWEWKAINGSAATSMELIKAFLKEEDKVVAKSILQYLSKKVTSEPWTCTESHIAPEKAKDRYPNWDDFSESEKETVRNRLMSENREMRKAYATFVLKVKQSLTKREVDPSDIQLIVHSNGNLEGSQHQPVVYDFSRVHSVADVFAELSRHCSWFNYESIKVIVEILENEDEGKYLKTYEEEHLMPYLKHSIFEIPCSLDNKSERTNLHFKVSKDLFMTGRKVKAIQQNLANLLGLDNSAFLHFEDYTEGCIELIFSLPTVILNEISRKSHFIVALENSKSCYETNLDPVKVLSYAEKPEVSILMKLHGKKDNKMESAYDVECVHKDMEGLQSQKVTEFMNPLATSDTYHFIPPPTKSIKVLRGKYSSNGIVCYRNCQILRGGALEEGDIWVQNGEIIDPMTLGEHQPESTIECQGLIASPGFIDLLVKGIAGHDLNIFSSTTEAETGLLKASSYLLKHGVTSFCPTIVTSSTEYYKMVLPVMKRKIGGKQGAAVLGAHVEGPFINREKKGPHKLPFVQNEISKEAVLKSYSSLENIRIITLAPEIPGSQSVISWLSKQGILVSLGHSTADLETSEKAFISGASMITHLFNAMLQFHHREPGMFGLLGSLKLDKDVYYGLITDGWHTHETVQRIAQKSNPDGVILMSNAMATVIPIEKRIIFSNNLLAKDMEVDEHVHGINASKNSTATMDDCLRNFLKATDCGVPAALEAASLHPAMVLGEHKKGRLDIGADADIVFLTEWSHENKYGLEVCATIIAGEIVWQTDNCPLYKVEI